MATPQKVTTLSINRFQNTRYYEVYKDNPEVREGLNLVPLDELGGFKWEWKQAYNGRINQTGRVICTLPNGAKECIVIFEGGRDSSSNSLEMQVYINLVNSWKSNTLYYFVPRVPNTGNNFQFMKIGVRMNNEIYIDEWSYINSANVTAVYWR